jgi:HSP20 family protein
MDLIRIRRTVPQDVTDLHRRMEQVMDGLMRGLRPPRPSGSFVPHADVHETEAGLLVTLDVAGVRREDIEIVVEGQALRVTGIRHEPEGTACLRWHQLEINYGPFERLIALPPSADVDGIAAAYRDGFLQITVPLHVEGNARQVPIDAT